MAIPAIPAHGANWDAWAAGIDAAARAAAVASSLATVATSGAYADLSGKPAVPAVQQVAATVTSSGALVANKHNPVDANSGAKTMTLPTGQSEGTQISVEKTDASTNTVAVTGSVRGVGGTTISLPWQNESIVLRADSVGSWWPIAGHKTKTALDAAYTPQRAATFVLAGDSRIATEYVAGSGNSTGTLQRGIFAWANLALRQRCTVLKYAGISGNTTDDLLARYATDVLAFNPGNVLLGIGVNDISAGKSAAYIQTNIQSMLDQNRAIGARTFLLTINPNAAHTTAQKAVLTALNRWILTLDQVGVVAVNVTPPIVAASGLTWGANQSLGDNLHQSRWGAARMGKVLAAVLDPLIPKRDPLPLYDGDTANAVTNAMISDAPGAGVIPAGYAVFPSTSSLYSVVARTDQVAGNWFQIDTSTASTDTFFSQTSTGLPAGAVAGTDSLYAVCEMQSDAWTAATACYFYLQFLDTSNVVLGTVNALVNNTTSLGTGGADSTAYPVESQPGIGTPVVFRTPPLLIPAAAVKVKPLFEWNGQGKVRLSRFGVYKL